MDAERWEKVIELYHAASERDPALRGAFLANACEGDAGLRSEVESLLRQDLSEGDMLERVAEDNRIWSPVAKLNSDSHPMALSVGTRLGHYEVLAPLGAGGMGEVYRAKDTKLDREVAIKILPDALTQDRERLARFEREAKVLASLNHPHIAQIYAVEQTALVIEFVDGRPLKGPLPVETALHYSKQIADALGAAHEKRIIHRDLKPANVMITQAGEVKVLDFGLAAVTTASDSTSGDAAASPTLTLSPSRPGIILGTPAYMAPEQARGEKVDKRADIWAFGCLLYEMLTGKSLFKGDTASDILAAVMREAPSLEAVPSYLRPALEKCLRKDPRRRWRDIGDAQMALEEAQVEDVLPRPARQRTALPWTLTSIMAAALSLVLLLLWPRAPDRPLMRLQVDLGPDAFLSGPNSSTFAISPDGSGLVYGTTGADGQVRLAVRRLDQAQATVLAGTEGARTPFFSPDGQWIGFNAAGKLKKISTHGGAVTGLSDAPNFRGATWTEDGFIIAAPDTQGPLMRLSASGGVLKPLTQLDKATGESTHRWPQVLPGGKAVLFTSHTTTGNYEDAAIVAQSLVTGRRNVLWRGGSYGRYVLSGHLLFAHAGTLFAVPMDVDRLKLTGDPSPVLESVASYPVTGAASFDFARNGLLVFQSGESSQREAMYWIRASGLPQLVSTFPGAFSLRLSPDGRRIALSVSEGSSREVWIYDLERGTRTRLTFGGDGSNPIWTLDGKNIVYVFRNEIQSVRADGAGETTRLYASSGSPQLGSFSPDGKHLVFGIQAAGTGGDLWTMPVGVLPDGRLKAGPPEPFLKTPFNELDAEFSPDGNWIAYLSDETGRPEVYVRPFPGPGGRWQISDGGGSFPVWSRNAQELFYVAADHLMVTSYRSDRASFTAEKPRVWAENFVHPYNFYRRFDLASDGRRVLQLKPLSNEREKSASEATFLLNFFDEVRRRAPARR
jgi:serine/threonine-protein kinase